MEITGVCVPPSWFTYITVQDMEGMPGYKLFTISENSVAGIFKKTEQMKELPSHWSIYFAVDDTDRIAEKTKSLGGEIVKPPADTGIGRIAVLKDPQGVVFQVIAYSGG